MLHVAFRNGKPRARYPRISPKLSSAIRRAQLQIVGHGASRKNGDCGTKKSISPMRMRQKHLTSKLRVTGSIPVGQAKKSFKNQLVTIKAIAACRMFFCSCKLVRPTATILFSLACASSRGELWLLFDISRVRWRRFSAFVVRRVAATNSPEISHRFRKQSR
jgi:hypothetical protein